MQRPWGRKVMAWFDESISILRGWDFVLGAPGSHGRAGSRAEAPLSCMEDALEGQRRLKQRCGEDPDCGLLPMWRCFAPPLVFTRSHVLTAGQQQSCICLLCRCD